MGAVLRPVPCPEVSPYTAPLLRMPLLETIQGADSSSDIKSNSMYRSDMRNGHDNVGFAKVSWSLFQALFQLGILVCEDEYFHLWAQTENTRN